MDPLKALEEKRDRDAVEAIASVLRFTMDANARVHKDFTPERIATALLECYAGLIVGQILHQAGADCSHGMDKRYPHVTAFTAQLIQKLARLTATEANTFFGGEAMQIHMHRGPRQAEEN